MSAPSTSAGGRALPEDSTVHCGFFSSVTVWLALSSPPGRYSLTTPLTRTWSPTRALGVVEPVNTNRPSLVRGSASGSGSCSQKPRAEPCERTPVTIPGTPATGLPLSGEIRVVPWMSCTRTVTGSGSGSGSGPGSGPPSPGVWPAALVGVGAPAVKSAALSSVSGRSAPLAASTVLATEVVLLVAGAGLPSRTAAAP